MTPFYFFTEKQTKKLKSKKKKKNLTSPFSFPFLEMADLRNRFRPTESPDASRTQVPSVTSRPGPSSQVQVQPTPVSRVTSGGSPALAVTNPFQARDQEAFMTVGDATTLFLAVQTMLNTFVGVVSATLTEVKEIQDQTKALLIPMLSFGEKSPYNEDAIKAAKTLLSRFRLIPADAELLEAAPAAFASFLKIESVKSQYKRFVSVPPIQTEGETSLIFIPSFR